MRWLISMETYDKEIHGEILWVCKRCRIYVVVSSLFYVLFCFIFSIYFIPQGISGYLFLILPVAFSLLRIHWLHEPVALICENKFLLPVSPMSSNFNWQSLSNPLYVVLSYSEIAGVSENWEFLFVGERMSGGMAEIPVQFKFVSRKDKKLLETWIEKKQRKEES